MRGIIDVVTNTLLLIACAVTLVVMYPRAKAQLFSTRPDSVKVGQQVVIPDFRAGRKTLILGIRPGCQWCERDFPIYRKLRETEKVLDGTVDIVVLLPPSDTPSYRSDAEKWLDENKTPGAL